MKELSCARDTVFCGRNCALNKEKPGERGCTSTIIKIHSCRRGNACMYVIMGCMRECTSDLGGDIMDHGFLYRELNIGFYSSKPALRTAI